MRHLHLLMLGLILAAAPAAASDEVPFEHSPLKFADAGACRVHLVQWVAEARGKQVAGLQGPYEVAAGDVRAHRVVADRSGHRITEQRCLRETLSSRSWRHSMSGGPEEEEETIDSMAAKAEWLKTDAKR